MGHRCISFSAALALMAISAGAPGCAAVSGRAGASVLDLPRPAGAEAFGVYVAGRKVGALESSVSVETREGREVLVSRSAVVLAVSVGSRVAQVMRTCEKVYEARPEGRLLAFALREQSREGARLAIDGRCTVEGCVASVETRGHREERRLSRVRETAELADVERLVATRRGDWSGPELVVERLDVIETRVRFAGVERVRDGAVDVDAVVVERFGGSDRQPTRSYFAVDGRRLEDRQGQFVTRAASAEEAYAPEGPLANLADLSRVLLPSDLRTDVPARLTFRIRGVPPAFRIGDARQAWTGSEDGSALVTVTVRSPRAATPSEDTPRTRRAPRDEAPYLAPTLAIDSDSPGIREAAREIAGDTRGAYATALAIMRHVSGSMALVNVPATHRASEALERRSGTVVERARLIVALARAAGVPARVVSGLAYRRYDGGNPALYWRCWVEVRSAGEWIALDPELGQAIADATHVKLDRFDGDDSVGLAGAVEVLSVGEESH